MTELAELATTPITVDRRRLIDSATALALLEAVVADRASGVDCHQSLLESCLARAGVSKTDASVLSRVDLRVLYAQRVLPIQLTLAAAVAVHIAQRGERLGLDDCTSITNARRVAARVPNIVHSEPRRRAAHTTVRPENARV